MCINKTLSIQKKLLDLTNKRFSQNYIKNNILPIVEYIVFSNKKKFLIGGSQGIGKTTLIKIIKNTIQNFYKKKVLVISLDDYYFKKKERISLAKKIHPLLITRGVPGTHDVMKLTKDIIKFDNSQYPIDIPIFDKLLDDRLSKSRKIKSKSDILILEGWCCGSGHLENNYLLKNNNYLEKNNDSKGVWRRYYNNQLKNDYKKLFNMFDKTIFFKAPSFKYILNWRIKQEKMNKSIYKNQKKMNKINIINFIQHYEKITKWMLKTLPKRSNLLIKVNCKQKISSINILKK